MLRIARTKKSIFLQPGNEEEKIFSQHGNLTALIKTHLSPVNASIFATPTETANSDEIEWSSELKGQPVPLKSLPKDEQQLAKQLLNDRLSAITRLADELPPQNPDTASLKPLLKQALHYPGDEAIFVVNGQPVITFWGVADKSINSNTPVPSPSLTSPSLPVKGVRKIPRFLSCLGWLLLLALLTFLLWYWFSKTPVNWQDYNPFIDQYQQLIDEIEEAGEDCLTLDNIYKNNKLLLRPEEKYNLVKQQLEVKLASCEAYRQLVKEIEQAKGNCLELKNIFKDHPRLQTPEGLFINLKQSLKEEINSCEYQKLKLEIQENENDCLKLNDIFNNNPYMQSPEGQFIELKEQLVLAIDLCEFNKLKSEIQSASGNCPELNNILKNNPYLQNPQGQFIELKNQLQDSTNLCAEYQTLKSKIESAKNDCVVLKKIANENQYLQQAEGMFVELKQKTDRLIKQCEQYQALENAIKQAGTDCKKLKKLSNDNNFLQNATGKFATLKKKLDKKKRPCEKKKIEELVNLCPGQRPKKLAPELVVVFDASGSMRHPAETSAKLQSLTRQVEAARRSGNAIGMIALSFALNAELAKLGSQQSRMYAAKKAVTRLVHKTPSDMNIGLVVLKKCPSAQKYRFYAPNERNQFLSEINRLSPRQGTPLGSGLAKAGQMIDGVKKPATIIVISDGEESCNADPCAIARRLAANKPYLTINVVDILGTGAGNCLARATKKGKVYTARNMRDIIAMTEKAASSAIPKHCKK